MNLNRQQFETAVKRGMDLHRELKSDYPELRLYPVYSRFGSGSGQCGVTTDLRKIVMEFQEMLASAGSHEKAQENTKWLRDLLFQINRTEKNGESEELSRLLEKADGIERQLLEPELKLYCGDVNIEFRCGILKYEPLRRLQQDSRLPPGLNTVGNIRVIAGSLEMLAGIRNG